ncbi:hypothetical protein [Streptacidiphilus sp. P02-A3a]|uniref:hypothetical protein n=1 Tax=Streptacidiphilus sp. P02-A3a TaxID=2704468 RepID=UPI0015F933ED|nr:hypothetical protein [Streptacidiphilus sp. P02-A3a]QMU72479.1 hypothetical protein GXP74_33770 [Streptacidiphilus sp. P02-A3a]
MPGPRLRPRDIDEAAAILAMVDASGGAPLPQLTDTDLCVFSDAFATMLDRDVWKAWLALPDPERVRRAELARGFLLHRRLLRAVPDAPPSQSLRIQPKLGFILAARQHPSFLGLCSVPGTSQPSAPHLFGLSDASRAATPALLMEQVSARQLPGLGHVREYGLLRPHRAAKVLASWIAGTLRDPANPACALDIVTHSPQSRPHVERVTVRAASAGASLRVEHTRPDGSYVQRAGLDEPALADLVTPVLTAAATAQG